MRFFLYEDDQIPRHPAAWRCIAFARHAELHAFANAGRYVYADGFLATHNAIAMTYVTFRQDGRPFAVTGWAGAGSLHLAQYGIGYPAHRTRTTASFTGLER